MNLFGRKKNVPKPDINSTIQTLRETQATLDKRENFLSKECISYREEARKYAKEKNKSKALYFLKKVKLLESQLDKIFNYKYNLETQISVLCEASINKETVAAMKTARDTLKINEVDVNVNKIADIMDDITESMDNVEEVSSILSAPIGNVTADDELLQELNEIEQELELKEQNLTVPSLNSLLNMPSVPAKISAQEKEENDLKELEKLML